MSSVAAMLLLVAALAYVVGARRFGQKALLLALLLGVAGTVLTRGLDALGAFLREHGTTILLLLLAVLALRAWLQVRVERRRVGRLLGENPTSQKLRVDRDS